MGVFYPPNQIAIYTSVVIYQTVPVSHMSIFLHLQKRYFVRATEGITMASTVAEYDCKMAAWPFEIGIPT